LKGEDLLLLDLALLLHFKLSLGMRKLHVGLADSSPLFVDTRFFRAKLLF
jgi:hypothetical protein